MPDGFQPKSQFEQYVYDKFERHTEIMEAQEAERLPQRVQALESNAKWYKNIAIVVGGLIGGFCTLVTQYFIERKGN